MAEKDYGKLVREIIGYLDRNPRRGQECDRDRVWQIRRLMYAIAAMGRAEELEIAPRMLENWLEGHGQPGGISYHTLLTDPNFRSGHEGLVSEFAEKACTGRSGSNLSHAAGTFDRSSRELFASFHIWDMLLATATFRPTDEPCTTPGGRPGCLVNIQAQFTFEDEYNWSENEATPLPGGGPFGPRFRQDWALELKACSRKLWPDNTLHPKDFTTRIRMSKYWSVCCP